MLKLLLKRWQEKEQKSEELFEELAKIIDLIEDKERVSVCFDTCHTHDAGYDTKK